MECDLCNCKNFSVKRGLDCVKTVCGAIGVLKLRLILLFDNLKSDAVGKEVL